MQTLLPKTYYNRALPKAFFPTFEEAIYGREEKEIGYLKGRTIIIKVFISL